jgi:hypothetical protein
MAKPGSIPMAFTGRISPDVKKATLETSLHNKVAFNMNEPELFRH